MRLFVYWFVRGAVQRALVWLDAALANDIFNAASPVSSGTVAVTVVDGLYQEDVATVPVVEPAVQPDVPKPEEAATQALSSSAHTAFISMDKRIYCNFCVKYGNMMHVM